MNNNRSWHNLKKEKVVKIKSKEDYVKKSYFILKTLFFLLLASVFVYFFKNNYLSEESAHNQSSTLVSKIYFKTNGFLTEELVQKSIDISPKDNLMDVDIFNIKEKLEDFEQVRLAKIRRKFPDSILIDIDEHLPFFKIRLGNQNDSRLRFVTSSGDLFNGFGYSEKLISSLPFLIPYKNLNGRFEPLLGIDVVSLLLNKFNMNPSLKILGLNSVSLENYSANAIDPGQIIVLNTKEISKIIFSSNNDFDMQLEKLSICLSYIDKEEYSNISQIDLSLIEFSKSNEYLDVAVQFK